MSDTTDPGTEVPGTSEATSTPPPAVTNDVVAAPKKQHIPGWVVLIVIVACLVGVYFVYMKVPTADDNPNRFKGNNSVNLGGGGPPPKKSGGAPSGGL